MVQAAAPRLWHAGFLAMLPIIVRHGKIAFRHLGYEAREEALQESICNACVAYARLVELGKEALAYPTVLAKYAVAQVNEGRKVGGRLNCRDVLSGYCQRVKGLTVERLDHYNEQEQAWQEIVIEDRNAGPADVARIRLDFAAWLRTLSRRRRRITELLATGESTGRVAKRFRLSAGRVSQLRKELCESWPSFPGEEPELAVA